MSSCNSVNQSFLFRQNAEYIENLYQKYLKNPASIDSSWITFFKNIIVMSMNIILLLLINLNLITTILVTS
nr:hypothetical protein [Orientia tsutsugamushi]